MADAEIDVLAFRDLDAEVDRIFRAYVDTHLLEHAHQSEGDRTKYWTSVLTMRATELGFPVMPSSPPAADRASDGLPLSLSEAAAALAGTEATAKAEEFAGFRYWFDVRAQYWGARSREDVEKVHRELVPANRLKWLGTEAGQLRDRIEAELLAPNRKGKSGAGMTASAGGSAEEADPVRDANRERGERLKSILGGIRKPTQ